MNTHVGLWGGLVTTMLRSYHIGDNACICVTNWHMSEIAMSDTWAGSRTWEKGERYIYVERYGHGGHWGAGGPKNTQTLAHSLESRKEEGGGCV